MGKIKDAISGMIEDLGTIEGATVRVEGGDLRVESYTRIDMDGDVICYADREITKEVTEIQDKSIDASISNRNAMIGFLINVTRKI